MIIFIAVEQRMTKALKEHNNHPVSAAGQALSAGGVEHAAEELKFNFKMRVQTPEEILSIISIHR